MRELVLGFIQGLTEFLPVSSSGHLAIIQNFYQGLDDTDVLFDILLHVGTLFVVFLYYRREIMALIRTALLWIVSGSVQSTCLLDQEAAHEIAMNRKMILLIIVGTIPTGLIGVTLRSIIKDSFSSLPLVASCLLITGIKLYLADTFGISSGRKAISYKDALIIGTVQGIAVFPGISRSGSTISTGILLGIDRTVAARFSFLLSIPAILGAVVLHSQNLLMLAQTPNFRLYLLGTLVAFLTGYAAITTLITLVVKRKLTWFSIYCWILGGGILIYSFLK
ncbi:undecaprenyl-diphosphatase [Candidatus Vecturithrix granuli]|uniref:Undecaprenyl-diphosphatase n=1 Tax=Vecturithrix granuli TaxID=1499967 RepID=A0A081BY08_VECG1|nr:undecaprenyl-diphosphatase [Candidatus Vecturithrix granuli]